MSFLVVLCHFVVIQYIIVAVLSLRGNFLSFLVVLHYFVVTFCVIGVILCHTEAILCLFDVFFWLFYVVL